MVRKSQIGEFEPQLLRFLRTWGLPYSQTKDLVTLKLIVMSQTFETSSKNNKPGFFLKEDYKAFPTLQHLKINYGRDIPKVLKAFGNKILHLEMAIYNPDQIDFQLFNLQTLQLEC